MNALKKPLKLRTTILKKHDQSLHVSRPSAAIVSDQHYTRTYEIITMSDLGHLRRILKECLLEYDAVKSGSYIVHEYVASIFKTAGKEKSD
jgi:hypothetical protein